MCVNMRYVWIRRSKRNYLWFVVTIVAKLKSSGQKSERVCVRICACVTIHGIHACIITRPCARCWQKIYPCIRLILCFCTNFSYFLSFTFFLPFFCFIIEFLSHSEELMCTVHSFASGGFYSGKSHPSPRMYVSRGVRASAHARLFLESHLGVKMKNNIATEDVPGRGGWNFLFSSPRRVSFIQKENIRNCLCRLWLSVYVLLWCCFLICLVLFSNL